MDIHRVIPVSYTHLITKFTQISLFSVLNNLSNISFEPEYAAICGITKEEMLRNFKPEIDKLAAYENHTYDEAVAQLTAYYDGYHFSHDNMADIFNPFSLVNALSDSKLRNYWAASGATSLLPKFVDNIEIRLKNFENCPIDSDTLETSDVTGGGAELFLYQSGYLTIKGYTDGIYILGIPNYEVRKALYKMVERLHPALKSRMWNRTRRKKLYNNSLLQHDRRSSARSWTPGAPAGDIKTHRST